MNISQIHPVAGYVIVKEQEEGEVKTASGLILTTGTEKQSDGTIVALADDLKETYKIGDKIIFKRWTVNEYKISDKTYQFVKHEDVLALIKE
jgi:chaperonin GroES